MACQILIASNLADDKNELFWKDVEALWEDGEALWENEKISTNAATINKLKMDKYRWNVMFFYGRMTGDILLKSLRFDNHVTKGNRRADLYSLELAYQLKHENLFRKILQPILSTIDLAINVTYQNDPIGNIYEINPYIRFVWQNFPWSGYINTIFAFGEGLSYATSIQQQDLIYPDRIHERKRVLNFLAFEAGLSLPQYPQLEIYYRLHHRSGLFGIYSRRQGTTAMGGAIRYHFNL